MVTSRAKWHTFSGRNLGVPLFHPPRSPASIGNLSGISAGHWLLKRVTRSNPSRNRLTLLPAVPYGALCLPTLLSSASGNRGAQARASLMSPEEKLTGRVSPAPEPPYNGAELGMLAHLYRAEMYRSKIWRTRLDATTNWAVATTGIALSVTFSNAGNSPLPLVLVALLDLVFLSIEARRYR